MNASLGRLRDLPPGTRVYCGHEYTAANLRFALAVEADNPDANRYRDRVAQMRANGLPSLPSELALEIKVNPFLRCGEESVRRAVLRHSGLPAEAGDAEVFGALRAWKDGFA
jgi:hydroxyacylglutathione hydrolase